jgi:hypothetical protein
MPSISTAIACGSEMNPTALLAPTPRSGPQISAKSSEQPLMTAGCSPNSGVACTIAEQLDDARDAIEAAQRGLQRGEDRQTGLPGGSTSGGDIEIGADAPEI